MCFRLLFDNCSEIENARLLEETHWANVRVQPGPGGELLQPRPGPCGHGGEQAGPGPHSRSSHIQRENGQEVPGIRQGKFML